MHNKIKVSKCTVVSLMIIMNLIMKQQGLLIRLIAFREKPPYGGGSGMPCGACREFLNNIRS